MLKEMEGWDNYFVIPKNSEKVTAITLSKQVKFPPTAADLYNGKDELTKDKKEKRDGNIKFIFKDTMTFLNSSLEKNTQKLCESNHDFPYLRQSKLVKTRGQFDQRKFDLLIRKGVYPYDAIETFEDLNSKEFPDKEKFHSCLGIGRDISDKEWRHGMEVWNAFGCESMVDYSRIYCELDTILLLESFRPVCEFTRENYGIHPNHFYSLPSLALQCCLKGIHDQEVDKNIELLQDLEMIKFVSQGKVYINIYFDYHFYFVLSKARWADLYSWAEARFQPKRS